MEKKFFDKETKEEFKTMLLMLIIICTVFTIFYSLSPKSEVAADSPVQSNSESSAITTESKNTSESSKTESKVTSKAESSQVKIQPPPKLDGTQQAIAIDNSEINKGTLILVNKDYPSYIDGEDAVSLYDYKTSSYTVADTDVFINKSIIDYTNQMFDDYYSIYGESDIYIACAYRSYQTQEGLYNAELDTNPDGGSNLVAPPGYSEHQTGYVFDIDHYNDSEKSGISFHDEGDDAWFIENCANYGFILRYPKDKVDITKYDYESWHYRYVGIPHAIYMKQNNLCLEEYIEQIKNNTKDNPLTVSSNDGTTWSMWYEKAYEDGDVTQIAVPKDCEYEISGNNIDGFIITVKSQR